MATITQTKLVGFGYGNKANYSATTYANHIWFDPTNKQILLNGIEYIPKKLSELVNDKNFITSITKSMVEGVLTGNITSHTHSYLPLSGGTLTGDLILPYNKRITTGGLVIDHKYSPEVNNIIYKNNRINPSEGGWADEIITVKDSTDNSVCSFGVYGNNNKLSYSYLGTNPYDGDNFRIYSDKLAFGNNVIYHAGNLNKSIIENVLTGNITSHTHSYLPLTGGTLTGALTCNGDYINMNNDSGSRGYRGFFNQSNSTSRASGSHIFMKGGGEALGTNSVSIGYQAYAGIRNKDSDATTYPYIAWQWMPSEKIHITINNQDTANGEFYGYEVLGGKMVQYELGGNTYTYENTSTTVRVLVCVKDDADTGLIFGGKSYMPFNATKTLIEGKYILGSGESITAVNTVTVGEVNYYVLAIYTWSATVGFDYSTQVKVMCATKVNNSNYNGASSYASGNSSVASGTSSVASGYYSVASGYSSVASGYSSVASGYYSVASGYSSVASGAYSVASGAYSVASGYYSVASGTSSVASGAYSVASGFSSVASGNYSVASGLYSVASGDFSVVLARNGETQSSYQTIVGRYNAKVAGLFIIGNGTSETARSNAFVVDDSGNVTAKYFSGYAHAVGNEGLKVYATNSNEINFGGISSSTTIYFGFRSMDSRPTPTIYDFGKGNAIIQASSFSGNAATATNADTLDGYHASNLVKFYLSPMSSGAPADSAKSWFIDTMPAGTGAIVYNVPGSEKTIIAGKSTGPYGHMLQLNYDDNYLRILRYARSVWMTTDWEKISAGYADTATALTSSAGSATQPIYFSNGKPVACSYTLAKSVPSNAVFTDTTYSVATASADGLMSAAMFKAQMVKSVGIKQGDEMMKPDGTITITDHRVYITQDKSNINGVYQTASGDNNVKIPNATKDYDGSMSYTDKIFLESLKNISGGDSVYERTDNSMQIESAMEYGDYEEVHYWNLPMATTSLCGLMTGTDKKKLDKMPNTVFGFRLDIDDASTVSISDTFGDYRIGYEDATGEDVNTIQTNNHYITLIAFTITNDELKNKLQNRLVKFGYSSKDSATYQTMRLLQSNFGGGQLFIEYIHTEPQYNISFDCIWELY